MTARKQHAVESSETRLEGIDLELSQARVRSRREQASRVVAALLIAPGNRLSPMDAARLAAEYVNAIEQWV